MALIDIQAWEISCRDSSGGSRDFRESIFSQGNGYMGLRGYRPDERGLHSAQRSTFFSGFYEYIRPGITDMVNQPDAMRTEIAVNGVDAGACAISDYSETLSMRDGLLTWRYVLTDPDRRQTQVTIERLISMDDVHTAAVRFSFCPLNHDAVLTLTTGVDGNVDNFPISDNQLQDNIEFLHLFQLLDARAGCDDGYLVVQTKTSHRRTAVCYRVKDSGAATRQGIFESGYAATRLSTTIPRGSTYRAEKHIAVACYRDGENPHAIAAQHLLGCGSFDEMHRASAAAWKAVWANADVRLESNPLWQGAARYNIFQLIQSTPRGDEHASIGARGLMHGRYKGCYFWDTEIFMLPMFLYAMPETARNLLLYRYHTLEDAKESARRFSERGARYSWMASDTGLEQCETWDTGCCEIHITADIAYAMGKYVELTGDTDFLYRYAAEVYIETARYWSGRFNYSAADDRYHLLFVKGPDEYCGVTTNDFYTVYLARHNLLLALDAIKRLRREAPERYAKLRQKTGFSDEETAVWRRMTERMVMFRDEQTKLWRQDDTFERLERIDAAAQKDSDEPLYRKISFDRLQRLQVLKQPAVLMCMALFPESFTQEEVEAAWQYYEPKTLHDSTLSFGIHALIAARLGRTAEAVKYFEKALLLDLHDIMRNTGREGLHMAALGAAWQALVLGFGGVGACAGQIKAENRLPAAISGMSFTVISRGKRYSVRQQTGRPPLIEQKNGHDVG